MEYPSIIVDLSQELKEIEIIPIGDVHYGSPEHNGKLFNEVIEKVKTEKNMFCILLGDLIECVTKDSVGDLYTQIGSPHDQANYIVEKLKPIKDKILAMTNGNHENRVFKTTGFDISLYIAEKLGIADRYNKGSCVLFVRFGKQRGKANAPHIFSIVVSHGTASSTKKAGKLNALLKLQETVVGADIYIIGHVHDYICTYEETYMVNNKYKEIKAKTSCLLSQGAFLDFGGYGYEKGYKPLAKRHAIITLGYKMKLKKPDEKYVFVKG